jgi:hypothetical protein
VLAALAGCRDREVDRGPNALPESLPSGRYDPRKDRRIEIERGDDADLRAGLLARLRVWERPAVPIERRDFARNPGDPPLDASVACKFRLTEPKGTTPKFECILPDGEVLKVKYGGDPEIAGEIATSRLLTALGFGADQVSLLRTLRCFGCPKHPFFVSQGLYASGAAKTYEESIDFGAYVDFEWVSVDRGHPAPTIVVGGKGWAWHELAVVDSRAGGASRAELDALRLLAVFLAHWDNKATNQRLVCARPVEEGKAAPCAAPFAVVQDVGATFGPHKVDLEGWKGVAIWPDPEGCRVSMKGLPFDGATFVDVVISEEGRALLSDLLSKLSRRQVEGLFTTARFGETAGPLGRPRPVAEWADVFEAKVQAIRDRRCGPARGRTPS